MADRTLGEKELGAMLQASRDFAFQLLAEKGKIVPFGARAGESGDIEFMRVADEESTDPLDEVYDSTQAALAEQAGEGAIIAATSVAHVAVEGGIGEEGFDRAIRIHVESDGFSRMIFAPYRVVQGEQKGTATIEPGKMVAQEAEGVVFAA
ncbi:hypothetical protein [Alteraurantiacibacter aquimixticola]|uniref:Uncharacterized protein n=1 Tax=Alteraurantiacibacter aquimixticola TaxID=2489173 RepID=A0A4T3F554_9SPHN|nr:hypothetical protein [Alteraurantiacibacter aquimixticola]TIX51609.1 hypothetical protein E5222_03920 [Alteraurantiacibacter aquimixticola]